MTPSTDPLPRTPSPPYYAVIFTTLRSSKDEKGYGEMAARMEELAAQQPGYLGIEAVRDKAGLGITVSYWQSLDAVAAWRRHAEHLIAQQTGRERWYDAYTLRVCRVERDVFFTRPT